MSEAALKPCPFCGGEAYTRFAKGNNGKYGYAGYASVECKRCGAVPYVLQGYSGEQEDRALEGVIKRWNRRAGDEA